MENIWLYYDEKKKSSKLSKVFGLVVIVVNIVITIVEMLDWQAINK